MTWNQICFWQFSYDNFGHFLYPIFHYLAISPSRICRPRGATKNSVFSYMFYEATSFIQDLNRWMHWINNAESEYWCSGAICDVSPQPSTTPTTSTSIEPSTQPNPTSALSPSPTSLPSGMPSWKPTSKICKPYINDKVRNKCGDPSDDATMSPLFGPKVGGTEIRITKIK